MNKRLVFNYVEMITKDFYDAKRSSFFKFS